MKFVIKHRHKGYMCEDEDCIGGWDYSNEIDEFTVMFDKREDAEFNCGKDEIVVEIMN